MHYSAPCEQHHSNSQHSQKLIESYSVWLLPLFYDLHFFQSNARIFSSLGTIKSFPSLQGLTRSQSSQHPRSSGLRIFRQPAQSFQKKFIGSLPNTLLGSLTRPMSESNIFLPLHFSQFCQLDNLRLSPVSLSHVSTHHIPAHPTQ